MSWVAVGAAVGVVGSGIISSRASKSAAETAAEGAERSGAQIERAADRARTDVLDFFPGAQQDLLAGAGAAGGLLAGGIGEQQRLLSAGNVGAQGTLQGGFGQVQNALLGLPVDQQAFAPQEIPLSQIPQNPLAQNIQQDPAAQQALRAQPTAQQQAAFDSATPEQQAAFSALTPEQLRFISGGQKTSGVIGGIQGAISQKAEKASSFLQSNPTNNDILSAIDRGELNATGVDLDWFNRLSADNPGFGGSRQLLNLANMTTSEFNENMAASGLNNENINKMSQLVSELKRLRG